jgi:hypothetical protein
LSGEAGRDSDSPEVARKWMDRSLASLGIPAEGENSEQMNIAARAHFQVLLGSAMKVAEQKKAEKPPVAPKPLSFWARLRK